VVCCVIGRSLKVLEKLLDRSGGVRVAQQSLLHLLDLLEEFFRLRFLGNLKQHRLAGSRYDHLRLLAQHLNALASEAGPRVVAVTELQPQVVELSLQW